MNKSFITHRLDLLNARMAGIMYNGLIQGEQKRQILLKIKKQVYRAAKKYGLNPSEGKHLWIHAYETYNTMYKASFFDLVKLKKAKDSENLKNIADTVYKTAKNALFVEKRMQKAAHRVANSVEQREKFGKLMENLAQIDDYTPFYLCSWHSDPAPDHKDYQGKMYYDADYREKLKKDPELLVRVRAYIHNRDLKKLQWVLNAPVYMMTRPNCRHFFTPVPCPEALSSGIPALLKRYDLKFNTEEAQEGEVESAENASRASRAYESRYRVHKELWKIMPNDELARDMERDRKLIKKWRKIAKGTEK